MIGAREEAARAPSNRRMAVFVCLLALLVDLNSLPGTFIGDDVDIVAGNPLVAKIDLGALVGTDYWGKGWNSGHYRPLTVLTFAVNRLLSSGNS